MIYKNIPLLIYFFSYALQSLNPNFVYISLAISTFILYEQIIKKKDDLFKIFLVLLPSLSPLVLNNIRLDNSIFFFTSIDPIFIATFFFFCRNCLIINLRKISLTFVLYGVLLLYAFVHLMIIYLNGQYSNMGLTYNFKAVLYVCTIFTIYNNDFSHFKKQILKIVILSLIILNIQAFINQPDDNIIITGHLMFITMAFLALIIYYEINLLNILIYLPFLFFIKNQSITLITIFVVSHLFIFLSKFRVVFNKFNLILLINFQIIFLISLFFLDLIYENYNEDNYFYTKFLYDRLQLYIASLEQINYFNFRSEPLNITVKNIITNTPWNWDSGSHNYFLNTAVALGLIPAVLLIIIINLFLIRLYKKIKNNFYITDNLPKLFFLSLISSFAVFSATGNAFSGSVGFLLFLLFGCLNSVINTVKKKQQGFRKNN
jgi:hypothetical protein